MPRIRAHLAVPAALALAIRAIHVGFLAARDPLFRVPLVDAWFHAQQALQILETGPLLPGSGAFYKGPLLSYLLAALIGVFGPQPGLIALRIVNVVAGCLSVVLVARIAERLGGKGAAWSAGIAAALYGTAVHFDTTTLLTPIVTLSLLVAGDRLVAMQDHRDRAVSLAFQAGLALGVASITRANALLLVPVAALWVVLGVSREARREAVRPAILLALAAAIAILPVTLRNTYLEKDPVVVSWNGGVNFFVGNDPAFDQYSGNWHPDLAWMRVESAPRRLGRTRGGEQQRFFVGQSLLRAARDPAGQAETLAKKLAILIAPHEIPNNRRFEELYDASPLLGLLMAGWGRFQLPLSIVAPLLAAGLVLGGRGNARRAAPLMLMSCAWAVAPVIFFNTARYRLPAVLLLLPVAAAGFWVARPERAKRIAAVVAAVAFFSAGLIADPSGAAEPPAQEVLFAEVAMRDGQVEEGVASLRIRVAKAPGDLLARHRLGDALRITRRPDEAIEQFTAVLASEGVDADAYNGALRGLARSHAMRGDLPAAIRAFRRLVDREPDRPVEGGVPLFHLQGIPPLVQCGARLELAQALESAGNLPGAAAELSQVVGLCSESERLAGRARSGLERLATQRGER